MAFPQSQVDDIVATTIENRSKKAASNVMRQNALLDYIDRSGSARDFIDGGTKIVQEIEYALNGTAMWYSGETSAPLAA